MLLTPVSSSRKKNLLRPRSFPVARGRSCALQCARRAGDERAVGDGTATRQDALDLTARKC